MRAAELLSKPSRMTKKQHPTGAPWRNFYGRFKGKTLRDSQLTYLEAAHPTPPLMGTTPEDKASVMMWNAIVEQQGGQPIAETLRNSNPHMKDRAVTGPTNYAQIPELALRGRARVAAFFDMLEQRLSHSPYLAGDTFTFADITAFVFVDFARVIKARIPEGNTATRAWFDGVAARPSAAL